MFSFMLCVLDHVFCAQMAPEDNVNNSKHRADSGVPVGSATTSNWFETPDAPTPDLLLLLQSPCFH